MEFVSARTRSIGKANALHRKWGGVLLIDGDGSYMIVSIEKDVAAFGRTSEYLDGLAPSWSEAHHDNAQGREKNMPKQLALF